MLARGGGARRRRRSALALAALACVVPARALSSDTVPMAAPFPSPEPGDAPRAWLGARIQRDWESFAMTLSDGTRYARPRPADRFAVEVGFTFGPRLSASLDVSGMGLGTALQVDLAESPGAKLAAVLQAELLTSGFGGGAALAASASRSLGGARLVPFVQIGAHAGRVSLERGVRDRATPYNEADRVELALAGTAGASLVWRSLELTVAAGHRAVAAAGRFDELRPADASRDGGPLAMAYLRWSFPLGPRRG
jgi:hypothetical protein